MNSSKVNTDVNNVKKEPLRIRRARELLKEIGCSDDRNFYSLLNKVNKRLEDEGLRPLSQDGFVDVIESIGWAI
jgi:hypothetical protein